MALKLTRLSALSTVMLTGVGVGLLATIFWGLAEQAKPYKSLAKFNECINVFQSFESRMLQFFTRPTEDGRLFLSEEFGKFETGCQPEFPDNVQAATRDVVTSMRAIVDDTLPKAVAGEDVGFEVDDALALMYDTLKAAEPLFDVYRDHTQKRVSYIMGGLVCLIFVAAGLIAYLLRQIVVVILRFMPAFDAYASGDLSRPLDAKPRTAEFVSLQAAANNLREKLGGLIRAVTQSASQVHQSGQETTQTADQLNDNTNHQRDQMAMISSAITELAASISDVAQNAAGMADAAQDADQAADSGRKMAGDAIESMLALAREVETVAKTITALNQKAIEIGDVLGVIEQIADQTNLLALNAAIEAARAGDQGRGFAVVAGEVRDLSLKTGTSAKEIRDIIGQLQAVSKQAVTDMEAQSSRAKQTVSKAEQTDAALERIVSAVENIRDQAITVASTTEEQAATANEINDSITKIAETAEVSASLATKVASLAESLEDNAATLARQTESFRT